MLTITNQSDYGFLMIGYLLDKKKYVSLSELLTGVKLPHRFLARISAELVKSGIMESKEGKTGGYRLSPKIGKVSLYEYLKIFEKDVSMAKCVEEDFDCPYDEMCLHKTYLRHRLNGIVVSELKKTRLIDMFKK